MRQSSQQINAFSKPPVITQMIAYVTVITQFLVFTICMSSNLINIQARNGLMITFYITFALTLVFWFLTSKTTVSDNLTKTTNKIFDRNSAQISLLYCDKCKSLVQEHSIHCRKCEVCVQGFDHHCIWINHCIGRQNYKYFLFMVSSVDLNFILYLATLSQLWKENNFDHFEVKMITAWCLSPFMALFSMLLTALIVFHIYLSYTKTTTFLFWAKNGASPADQQYISNVPQPEIDQKIVKQEEKVQKKEQIYFELNKKMEISQSIHNLKIQKSRSNLTSFSKQKIVDSKKYINKA